jgi:large subunit ribosomal protein L18
VQLIDDVAQNTIASASTVDPEVKGKIESGSNCAAATEVGKLIAERAKAKGIEQVVFDRGGNLYHGRVQTLADAAREAGLNF